MAKEEEEPTTEELEGAAVKARRAVLGAGATDRRVAIMAERGR